MTSGLIKSTQFCVLLISVVGVYATISTEDSYRTFQKCFLLSPNITRISIELPQHRRVELIWKRDLVYLDSYIQRHDVRNIVILIYCANVSTPLKFNLKSSPLILSKWLKVTYFDSNNKPKQDYIGSGNFSCFYAGYGSGGQGFSHFHLCSGGFEGEITLITVFTVTMNVNPDGQLVFTLTPKGLQPLTICGNENDMEARGNTFHRRGRREVLPVHPPARSNGTTRYIEMYIVIDHNLYNRSGSDRTKAVQRIVKILNYASSLYRKMNIYLALIGVEIWSFRNPFPVAGKVDDVLIAFEKYRIADINPKHPNDNAQLFAANVFDDGKIGQGSWSICSHTGGVAVTADHNEEDWIVAATTMTHELGHNLGLPHDNQKPYGEGECTCSQTGGDSDRCIMYSSSDGGMQPINWSQCSIDKIQEAFHTRGIDYCLLNLPDAVRLEASCGNFFVDEGEECDCGPAAECDNRCCQPLTCELARGAQCATGTCCDKEECVWKPAASVCRPVSDEQCDLEEYCDGESEWCPADTYKFDGFPCTAFSPALCYHGMCKSRDTQCEYVWGTSVQSSVDECYTQWNPYGDYFGHCGYNIMDGNSSLIELEYNECRIEDALCGMLHCDTNKTDGVLGLRVYVDFISNFVGKDRKRCHTVIFDVGLDLFDPGMVPEGSVCGENQWCRSQQCVDIPVIPAYCNCSGKGVCNQYLNCHCNSEFDPQTNCSGAGQGGSVESGPARIYSVPTTIKTTVTTTYPDESPPTDDWVTPVAVSVGVIGGVGVVVGIVLAVLKRRYIAQCIEQMRINKRAGSAKDFTKVLDSDRDTKISGALSNISTNKSTASSRHGLISEPILESTTINSSIVLYDIPIASPNPAPNTNIVSPPRPVTNPIYYSKLDGMQATSTVGAIPIRLAAINRCSKVASNAYSECEFSDDSDSDAEDAHPYEDVPVI